MGTVLALSWIAPPMDAYTGSPEALELLALDRSWPTVPAYLSGLLALVLMICSLRTCSARVLFIPCFAIFGVALHAIYGFGESFLFSANYTWASVLSAGLLGRHLVFRQMTWIACVLAVALFIINVTIWMHGIDWIEANGYLLPNAR